MAKQHYQFVMKGRLSYILYYWKLNASFFTSSFNDRKLERNDVVTSKSDLGHEFTQLTNLYLLVILRWPNLFHNLFHFSFLQFGMTSFQRLSHQLNNFVILQINSQLLR